MKYFTMALAAVLLGLLAYIVLTAADLHSSLGWIEVTATFLAVVLLVRLVLEHWHHRDK